MKKTVMILFTALTLMVLMAFSASAYERYGFYEADDYYTVNYEPDLVNCTATIVGYDSYTSMAIIPKYVKYYDDGESISLLVTSIKGFIDCEDYDSIIIPDSVTSIDEYSVGYGRDYVYDYETGEEVLLYMKSTVFEIKCTQDSYAQKHAIKQGFKYSTVKYAADFEVSFNEGSYTYTGDEIIPNITVKYDGKVLQSGKDYYCYDCYDNVDAGTGKLVIAGSGDYIGEKSVEFTIEPAPANLITVNELEDEEYSGYEKEPYISAYFGDERLWEDDDYTLEYKNNIYPGKACAELTFKGNFTGTLTVSFEIYLGTVSELTASTDSSSSIYLDWYGFWGYDNEEYFYYVYRYNSSTKKYEFIGKTQSTYYYDEKLTQCKTYAYKVVPVLRVTVDGQKTYYKGKSKTVKCTTLLASPALELTLLKNSVKITWKKNSKADGYAIYRASLYNGGEKCIKTLTSNAAGSYTDKSVSTYGAYVYWIKSYKITDGKKVFGEEGNYYSTYDADVILRGATKKSKTSFKVYNKQGKTSTSYTYNLSSNDIKILKDFASKNFKSGMSDADKLYTTLQWINRNITYATGTNWNKISGKSWVEAIFKMKLGQCAQYNGAMAAMMVYLGYDACVIQGYRGSYYGNRWQHFWCEVNIQGRRYIMETGNYGKDGSWSYFLCPYAYTSGYVINCQAADVLYGVPEVGSVKLSATSFVYNGEVQRPTVKAVSTTGATLKKNTDYTVKYSKGCTDVGKYTVTVTFKGDYEGTAELTYYIVPKTTSISSLTAGKGALTVKWKKQATQTSGYVIQYSTSSNMKNAKAVSVKDAQSVSKTISKLSSGKTYYVRIRTYKTTQFNSAKLNVYSGWSKISSVKVK